MLLDARYNKIPVLIGLFLIDLMLVSVCRFSEHESDTLILILIWRQICSPSSLFSCHNGEPEEGGTEYEIYEGAL